MNRFLSPCLRVRLAFVCCPLVVLSLLFSSPCFSADLYVSTSFREPATDGLRFVYSRDGLRWDSIEGVFLRPEVGRQRVLRDPSIVRGPDGTFHLVWTSSWRGDRGFGYSSSRDLIHWAPQRFVSTGMDTTTVNTWAPELFYDDVKRLFLVVWASCVPGRFPDGQEDHLNNHRLYCMTTRDFKSFSPARLLCDPGFSAIDATIVKRGVKDYVMVLKDNSRPMRNIKVAFATSPYGPWGAASEPFTESFTEGPSTAKIGDWWYVYYDSYRHKIYGAHRTRDFKTFQDQTGAVTFPVGHKHGTVFMAPEELVEGLIKYNRDVVHYSGHTIARPERHDGGLKPVVGVHTIQTMRAGPVVGEASKLCSSIVGEASKLCSSSIVGEASKLCSSSIVGEASRLCDTAAAAKLGSFAYWTYNHQPMMTYWQGKFYMHYLTDPRHEHEAPGKTMLQTSRDGYAWTAPTELFPEYPVPEGWTKDSRPDLPPAHNLKAVMHQRVGWYVCTQPSLLLATGSYGICLTMQDDPNDGNGIGRVVRRVFDDGTLGPIFFVYYNHGFSERNTVFPYYKRSKDKELVKAVDQMLADPMQRMQWVEEADRGDPLIPLDKPYKAFSGYTLPDGRKVALWKHAVTSLSADGGNTWRLTDLGDGRLGCDRAPGFVNSNAKIWGQRLSDGTYATVYNPSEYRWPLAISLSADGLDYTTLSLVNGEVTPLRHGGQYKSYGPQYVRGIEAYSLTPGPSTKERGVDTPPAESPRDKSSHSPLPGVGAGGEAFEPDLWVAYSNNKEDIWVSRIPVPVRLDATTHAGGSFAQYATLADMTDWNLYSPLLAPVTIDGEWLTLSDSDPYDYAKAERVIPNTKELRVDFDLRFSQAGHGEIDIEFVDDEGTVCSRIVADSIGAIRVKGGARYGTLLRKYEPGVTYHVTATLSCDLHRATYSIAGTTEDAGSSGKCTRQFDTPVESISRLVFRTGPLFKEPDTDTPADQNFDQPLADVRLPETRFALARVASCPVGSCITAATASGEAPTPALLSYDSYAHYAARFNTMEDENILTTIPNDQASEWMRQNVPLFDCPDEQMREMYYYRWWTLRKHIKRTPVGYGMTEFLVQRSYADRYNLIACAIGHHIMESRWLRDSTYLHQILRTWYFGNDGQAMTKMNKFSSWNPFAVQQLFAVEGDTAFLLSLKPRLEEEYARWERTNRLPSGLYWQGDVQDGMEESISGGRRKQYARPTINSYMYGNATALAWMNTLTGESEKANRYQMKADTLRRLVCAHLWNPGHQFFETLRGDIVGEASKLCSPVVGEASKLCNPIVGEASKLCSPVVGEASKLCSPIVGEASKLCNPVVVGEASKLSGSEKGDTLAGVREAIGYIPWYLNLPTPTPQSLEASPTPQSLEASLTPQSLEASPTLQSLEASPTTGPTFDVAWLQLLDEKGFSAPYGLTTAERRHPQFRSHGVGKCEWDGAIWPFATSQTLTALANHLNNSPNTFSILRDSVFFRQMQLYTESQHHRGRPYIGEYLDENTGAWLMGDRERSRYYNHSTYNDLIITGICGLRPQLDGSIVVNPLLPKGKWAYFCLDGIGYHGHTLTIIWDEDGQRYHQGSGLTIMVDGRTVANRKDIGTLTTRTLNPNKP